MNPYTACSSFELYCFPSKGIEKPNTLLIKQLDVAVQWQFYGGSGSPSPNSLPHPLTVFLHDRYNIYHKMPAISMSDTLIGTCCKMSAAVQNKFQVSYLYTMKCQLLSCNKCPVSYLEMLGTYPTQQVYMKLLGTEMSYT